MSAVAARKGQDIHFHCQSCFHINTNLSDNLAEQHVVTDSQ